MNGINKNHTALAFGLFFAFFHLVWSVLVAIGLAKPLSDFILSLHHINLSYAIQDFSILKAIGLIIVTFIIGYILGWVFAVGWNFCKKQ